VDAFDKLYEWLEAEVHELLTLRKLRPLQYVILFNTTVYSHRQLKGICQSATLVATTLLYN